jgi:hypothetical protein
VFSALDASAELSVICGKIERKNLRSKCRSSTLCFSKVYSKRLASVPRQAPSDSEKSCISSRALRASRSSLRSRRSNAQSSLRCANLAQRSARCLRELTRFQPTISRKKRTHSILENCGFNSALVKAQMYAGCSPRCPFESRTGKNSSAFIPIPPCGWIRPYWK